MKMMMNNLSRGHRGFNVSNTLLKFSILLAKLLLNSLSPKRDQRQISPCNITAL